MSPTTRRQFLTRGAAALAGSSALPGLIRDALAIPANSVHGSLADVEHVVIFMQENRAFDHYFGTFPGVRGFDDPRAINLPSGRPVWYQPTSGGGYVLPYHFDAKNTSAMSVGTNHSWKGSQQTWQAWDAWVKQKTALSMGYFDRADLPFYYALADAFTICDAYHCSVFGATDPNRMYSLTGSNCGWMGSMGRLYNIDAAGYYNNDIRHDNNAPDVIASAPNWRTYAEVLQANQISWKVYQEWDNYGDNYLAYFKNFRVNPDGSKLSPNSPLYQHGRALVPGSVEANARGTRGDWLVNAFAEDVRQNRLPQVSWICAPNDYTEHSPNSPNAGEDLCARLLAALVANPDVWAKTVFLLTYDENDGFFDHMPPHMPPLNPQMGRSTLADQGVWESYQGVPVGLGPRVPMLIISPWSKGGRVCSQLFDHTSKLRFLEEWLVQGRGKRRADVSCDLISPWRRTICGDLTSAFDFRSPNQHWPATLPANRPWQKVSGKPLPQPPAVQVLPRQEAASGGSRPACPLPYHLAVEAQVNMRKQLSLSMYNRGSAGAALIVYSKLRSDGPWYYTLEAGKNILQEVWNWSGNAYHLRVHGANGFLREYAGSLPSTSAPVMQEVRCSEDPARLALQVYLSNPSGVNACQFTVIDKAYGRPNSVWRVAAGQTVSVEISCAAQHGWYDLQVSCDADPQFLRALAGHIENAQFSRTDPQIGRNPHAVKLQLPQARIQRGTSLAVQYGVGAEQQKAKNWLGVYASGSKPGSVSSLAWAYAPAANGTITLDTSKLAPGQYAVWYLYDDAYGVLAGPEIFTIV